MKSYSEDLRRKIVAAVEKRGMSKTQAAHLFDVSLSSVKRFSRMAREGNSLAPKKRPGRTPKVDEKAKKLLNEHMKERPAATIAERISFLQSITGERLKAIGAALDTVTAQDAHGFFGHCGYRVAVQFLRQAL
jgi:transposase